MNMKQKLTYMLIGCLFTLAGYVLSTLFNTPPHIQARDEQVRCELDDKLGEEHPDEPYGRVYYGEAT